MCKERHSYLRLGFVKNQIEYFTILEQKDKLLASYCRGALQILKELEHQLTEEEVLK
jgi:hypothetical protein